MIENKYKVLYLFLKKNHSKEIILKKKDVEKILGFPLPKSSGLRSWWSNNPEDGHTQAKAWIEAGYKVNIKENLVIFKKF